MGGSLLYYLTILSTLLNIADTDVTFESHPLSLMCNITVDAGPDQVACLPGATATLQGNILGPYINFEWTPATGLDDPFSLNPNATVTVPITYTLSGFAQSTTNLVINGDFGSGISGFSSDYEIAPGSCDAASVATYGILGCEGFYTVGTNPLLTHNDFCSGTDQDGNGSMLIANGSLTGGNVWCQNVTVTPNTFYDFSAWATSVESGSPGILQFTINGTPIGTALNLTPSTCNWLPFNATWNSAASSFATICILNTNTAEAGNDFAIDNIQFNELCEEFDMVTVTPVEAIASALPAVSLDCNDANICQFLNSAGSTTGPGVSYQWTASGPGTISPLMTKLVVD